MPDTYTISELDPESDDWEPRRKWWEEKERRDRMLTFGSLFSGAGGFDKALEQVGMRCLWQCEIDRQCRSVLARHWPDVTCYDDVRKVRAYLEPKNARRTVIRPERPDVLCGGFPCQDLSVAGRRAGLAGGRSGLWYTFRRIAALLRPGWLLIENVDGLRSSNGGRDLGTILWALGHMGYGWAYRVLDSQWFGLAQRRERVFIVGCLGDWRRAAEVLFERDCLPWHPAPSRAQGQSVAASLTRGADSGGKGGYAGRRREDDVNLAYCLNAKGGSGRIDGESETFVPVAHTLRAEGHDASEDGTGRGTPIIPILEATKRCGTRQSARDGLGIGEPGDPMFTLQAGAQHAMAFDERNVTSKGNRSRVEPGLPCHTLHSDAPRVASKYGVRRLTPRECERLQGFPDDWTRYDADGNELADSPRYRMMGNAVSIPPVKWLGRRVVEAAQPVRS